MQSMSDMGLLERLRLLTMLEDCEAKGDVPILAHLHIYFT